MVSLRNGRENRTGIAVRRSSKGLAIGCIAVKWDGTKTANYYHEDFIEIIPEQKQ